MVLPPVARGVGQPLLPREGCTIRNAKCAVNQPGGGVIFRVMELLRACVTRKKYLLIYLYLFIFIYSFIFILRRVGKKIA